MTQETTACSCGWPRPRACECCGEAFPTDPRDVEIKHLRAALSAIALEAMRCRGEQSYRDTIRFVEKEARAALRRGIER